MDWVTASQGNECPSLYQHLPLGTMTTAGPSSTLGVLPVLTLNLQALQRGTLSPPVGRHTSQEGKVVPFSLPRHSKKQRALPPSRPLRQKE